MSIKKEHRHLLRTWYFWGGLLIPLFLGFMLSLVVLNAEPKMIACYTSKCLQTFFDLYKFPIAIMGISLPLVAMVAAIHRSLEAAYQINLVSEQLAENVKNNRFGNYLKHREGFDKVIQTVCAHDAKGKGIEIDVDTATLYGEVFPESGYKKVGWNGEWSDLWIEKMDSAAAIILSEMKKASGNQFDAEVFFKAAGTVIRGMRLSHTPFVTIGLKGGSRLILPDYDCDNFGLSLMSGVANSFGILIVIRSYLGRNNSDDLMMASWYVDTINALNSQSEKFDIPEVERDENAPAV